MIDQLDREVSAEKRPILICPLKVFAKERDRDTTLPCKLGGE